VSRDPENTQYRLALADALTASRLDEEATRVLLELREAQPEDPEANLRLARLARTSDPDAARRYYQNASAGLWRPERADTRRQVQVELIEFLLARKEQARALSELLVLAANLPDEATVRAQVGRMFLAAGDPRVALDQFAVAIRLDAKHGEALAGAGEAAFELGDYSGALRYLNAVSPQNAPALELRELTELVITADPLAPRLGANERRRRLVAAFQQAVQRLGACPGVASTRSGAALEPLRLEAREFESVLKLPRGREPRDLVDDGLDLAYRIERAVGASCATPAAPFDRALVLIGRRHGFEQP
jgi:tetratricopeptide (TPR) repeat protein